MSNNVQSLGDTALTKVFVGGLAWETPKNALKQHFDQYGEILEAVIISDKLTGRSKGYGFVTFKDPEEAKKACEDGSPMINGRRANCNLASLGVKRQRPPPSNLPSAQGTNVGQRGYSAAHANHVQWYHPAGNAPASPYHHQHHQAVPFFGYSPTYITPDMSYNQKVGYNGGSYMSGHFYPGQAMMGPNTLMPMYPMYNYYQSQTLGLPAHLYSPTAAGPIPYVPSLMSKPMSIATTTGSLMQV